MLPTFRTVRATCFLLAAIQCSAHMQYRNLIPNGHQVPHPCIEGETWEGVGHLDPRGGGARNPFGIDFKETGNFQWTTELCQMDSDGDGFSNGEELGDPNCLWSEGDTPERTTNITHPGVCSPLHNESCAGRSTFVSCENIDPEDNLRCDNLNRSDVFHRDYTIPRTSVPIRETTYVCYTFNAPVDQDYYLVGMEPLIDNENIMHHIVVYGCPESTPLMNEPVDCVMGSLCDDIIGVWAFGFPGLCLPNDVGFLFGPNGYHKIQFEFHWDNTLLLDNQFDASGMRMHFEPGRPEMITAGVLLTGSILLQIPANQILHEEHGGCEGDCTSLIWTQPLNVFGGINHMHYIGVQQRTSVWRDGVKVRDIAYDLQASFDNPIYHRYDPPIVVRPGDSIETTCGYNSSGRQRTTYYGAGTNDEMCFFFAFFYPKENSLLPYCNKMGPLSQCRRNARSPIGNCDWNEFLNGVITQSLPIAQALRQNCIITGQCQPECRQVVEDLKLHPCMQDDLLMFISAWLEDSLEGVRFLARYSSCSEDTCPKPPSHGVRSARSSRGVLLTVAIVAFVFKVSA